MKRFFVIANLTPPPTLAMGFTTDVFGEVAVLAERLIGGFLAGRLEILQASADRRKELDFTFVPRGLEDQVVMNDMRMPANVASLPPLLSLRLLCR